jgi:hypothetical protein
MGSRTPGGHVLTANEKTGTRVSKSSTWLGSSQLSCKVDVRKDGALNKRGVPEP